MVSDDDAAAFRQLNEEWITRHFRLEPKDVETLIDPRGTILSKGGHVFVAYAAAEAVGCVALIPAGNGAYELSKMAVSPRLRGQGIGRQILEYAMARAREFGARSLYLGSSTKLPNAVHLYEQFGFQHVGPETLPGLAYGRADVFMQKVF